MGEASFDESYGTLEGDGLWGDEEVDVIGHDDEGVEFVVAFGSVVLKGFEEEFGVAVDLEEAAAIVGCAGDEVRAGREVRVGIAIGTSGAKAPFAAGMDGTAKAVPLTVRLDCGVAVGCVWRLVVVWRLVAVDCCSVVDGCSVVA
jgi:hypothetical protein